LLAHEGPPGEGRGGRRNASCSNGKGHFPRDVRQSRDIVPAKIVAAACRKNPGPEGRNNSLRGRLIDERKRKALDA